MAKWFIWFSNCELWNIIFFHTWKNSTGHRWRKKWLVFTVVIVTVIILILAWVNGRTYCEISENSLYAAEFVLIPSLVLTIFATYFGVRMANSLELVTGIKNKYQIVVCAVLLNCYVILYIGPKIIFGDTSTTNIFTSFSLLVKLLIDYFTLQTVSPPVKKRPPSLHVPVIESIY